MERQALAPLLDIDVRRRRWRQHEGAGPQADACGVADERDAAVGIEEAHMVGRVARRVGDR